MKSTKVASRYAKSLLELAIDQKKIDAVLGDMHFLLQTNNSSRDFELLLSSPIINSDKKIAVFELIFEQFEQLTMAFIKLITKNRRESMLAVIAEEFDRQVKEYKGIIPITIVSATSLAEDTKQKIIDKVKSSVKGELEITEEIDESLIGGFMVKMGDTRIDASVLSQFNNLKQRLTR